MIDSHMSNHALFTVLNRNHDVKSEDPEQKLEEPEEMWTDYHVPDNTVETGTDVGVAGDDEVEVVNEVPVFKPSHLMCRGCHTPFLTGQQYKKTQSGRYWHRQCWIQMSKGLGIDNVQRA